MKTHNKYRSVKTSAGSFYAPRWVNKKNNKRQIELIAIEWHIRFQNELKATKNRAYAIRKRILGY